MVTREVAVICSANALSIVNATMLSRAAITTWAQSTARPSASFRRCSSAIASSESAPSDSETVRMLNGGISSSATRIAGQVRPHERLSTTSISLALASVLCCGAGTRDLSLRNGRDRPRPS
jgi:hypothetical protein